MIDFPPNLVREIANKRSIFFIGSGISANSKSQNPQAAISSPLTWGRFIDGVKGLLNPLNPALSYIDDMISQNDYLKALQAIKNHCDSGRYADYLNKNFDEPHFAPSQIHEYIKDINCKIVITTNFDKIYETSCGTHGYTVVNYFDQISKIVSNMRSSQNLIIKAHGTIDDVNNIIFTENEFFEARRKHPEFYSILQSLFLTNTIVFLGYSLNDPDINLLLEIANRTKVESNPHYVFMPKGINQEVQRHWKDCYNINIFEYGDDYTYLEACIQDLAEEINTHKVTFNLPK
ncbi:SIR2 family protein [Paenibacillus sp. FSL K6-0276]|uniref:SIR2 family protein n=1 Tax=Paenibacillus sp. FSL K6-0276 TaxID=2921450 RepID=UPI0030EDCEFA